MSIFQDILGRNYKVRKNTNHVSSAIGWLKIAQDKSGDGGFAGWYSLLTGWAPSYIETTGYIITTLIDASEFLNDKILFKRATRASNFLLKMQLSDGSFRHHTPSVSKKETAITFNTGQDILGLCDIYKVSQNKKYLDAVRKAADWLVSIQEEDGSWKKYEHKERNYVYDSRVAWSLLKVWEITGRAKYKNAAIHNLEWTISKQSKNGWFFHCSLPDQKEDLPFTHTISYTIEGLIWSGIMLKQKRYIESGKKTADALLDYYREHDFMPGRFDKRWKSNDKFSCLTGDAQISIVWLKLYQLTGDEKYLNSARRLNHYLKGVQDIRTNNRNIKGALGGSDPLFGDLINFSGYSRMAYLNWATKFFVDALILEDLLMNKVKNPQDYFIFQI